MRLSISKSKLHFLYVIESTYKNGIRSSRIVEKLGTANEQKKLGARPYRMGKGNILPN